MTREEFIKFLIDDKKNWSICEETHQFQQPVNKILKLSIDTYVVTTTIKPNDDVEFLIKRYKSIFANEISMSIGFIETIDRLYQEYIVIEIIK